jgi:hypothetical protein
MKTVINSKDLHGNYWRFIEEWLPDYSSNAAVCLSNDIAAYFENGDNASPQCKANIIAHGGDLDDKAGLCELCDKTDTELLQRAMVHFLNVSYR